jgi:four helix bundle protein
MANIAEGFSRNTDRDFAHFLDIAKGSAIEVQSLLYIALDLEYISGDAFSRHYEMANECAAMTTGLARYLRNLPSSTGAAKSSFDSTQDSRLKTPDSL